MNYQWKKRLRQFWHAWMWPLLVALLLATSFKSAIADWNVVPTGSMKPTIVEGDRIFVNKLAYDLKLPYSTLQLATWQHPHRGDIVVFYSPKDGQRLVKRVVGLPGDSVSMRNNRLYINGTALQYEALGSFDPNGPAVLFQEDLAGAPHNVMFYPDQPSLKSFRPFTVPDNQYFMLGDNRDNSADSRYFGCVDRERIVGRATAVVISLDLANHYRPRWERFFSKLQ